MSQAQFINICLLLLIVGCGRLPAHYNQLVVDCGEMSGETIANAGRLFQPVDQKGALGPHGFEAHWLVGEKALQLQVSPRGCVLSPKGEGTLRLVSQDHQRGLLVDLPEEHPLTLHRVELKTLSQPQFNILCGKKPIQKWKDLDVQLIWKNFSEDDSWQIESIKLAIQNEQTPTPFQKISLSTQNLFLAQNLTLPEIVSSDGFYSLRAELTTIDQSVVVSESSCHVQLDTTKPLNPKLLATSLSDGTLPMRLKRESNSDRLYTCISTADKALCKNLDLFKITEEFLDAPLSGSYILNSYWMDEAGNRSALVQEAFFRDISPPHFRLEWSPENPLWGGSVALDRKLSYRFTMTLNDDSVKQGFVSNDELAQNLECRVNYISPRGSEGPGIGARCIDGLCKGHSLKEWTPCQGLSAIQIDNEQLLLDSLVVLRARIHDSIGHESGAQLSFWLNGDALGQWNAEPSLPLADFGNELAFTNDQSGRLLAFSPSYSDPFGLLIREDPVLFVKELFNESWSRPIRIESSVEILAFGRDRSFASDNLLDPSLGQSLWLATPNLDYSFAELPVSKKTESNITPIIHQVTPETTQKISGTRVVIQALPYKKGHLALLLVDHSQKNFALVDFDGAHYQLLASSDVPFKSEIKDNLVAGPNQTLILLLDQKLFRLDTVKNRVTELSINNDEPLHSLRQDRQGIFGQTNMGSLFTLSIAEDGGSASLQILDDSLRADTAGSRSIVNRTADGQYWMWTYSSDQGLYSFRPGIDKTWQNQEKLWGFEVNPSALENSYGFSIDGQDQIFAARPGGMLKTLSCEFIDVTEQGAFRLDVESRKTKSLNLVQDSQHNLWRAQILDSNRLAISMLDSSDTKFSEVQQVSLSSGVNGSRLIADPSDRLWVSDAFGTLYAFDPQSGNVSMAWDSGTSRWTQIFFDSFGQFWGIFDSKLMVRLGDGSILSLPTSSPVIRLQSLDKGQALVITKDQHGIEQLLTLDFKDRSLILATQLPDERLHFKNLVVTDSKRLALLGAADSLVGIVPDDSKKWRQNIEIFEDTGSGWKRSASSFQPRWPTWHPKAGQLIVTKPDQEVKFFFDSQTQSFWLGGKTEDGPVLAQWKQNAWNFFNPSHQHLKDPVDGIWQDRLGRLVLATTNQIFYHNSACQKTRSISGSADR